MENQELFEKLKKEGECWHDLESLTPFDPKIPYFFMCKKCGFLTDDCPEECNPQFLTPAGFFWLWERAKYMSDWRTFKNYIISGRGADFNENYINPTRFTETLKQYLEETK